MKIYFTTKRRPDIEGTIRVNKHEGRIGGLNSDGPECWVIDYQINDDNWANHGVYLDEVMADRQVSLLEAGFIGMNREERLFPRSKAEELGIWEECMEV
jgi:hypothetical protein